MTRLEKLFARYGHEDFTLGTDKGSVHSYIPIYEDVLFNLKIKSLLEVGVFTGSSLKVWEEYLPGAKVVGIDTDVSLVKPSLKLQRAKVIQSDSRTFTPELHRLVRKYSVIIDDGVHEIGHQLATLQNLWPLLEAGGVYFIEDVEQIDRDRKYFENLASLNKVSVKIHDLRSVKGRWDDVLVVISKNVPAATESTEPVSPLTLTDAMKNELCAPGSGDDSCSCKSKEGVELEPSTVAV